MIIRYLLVLITVCILPNVSQAEKELSRNEILAIFRHLTQSPSRGWINQGVIQARYEQYRAPEITDPNKLEARIKQTQEAYLGNENKAEQADFWQEARYNAIPFNIRYQFGNEVRNVSRETVYFDNGLYVWDYQVLSRDESIKPPPDQNDMYEFFDLKTNGHKIYHWDGKYYTIQFPLINTAQIFENALGVIPVVHGPFNAEKIAWGQKWYSYESLAQLPFKGVEQDGDIEITVKFKEVDRVFVFDKTRDYALLSVEAYYPKAEEMDICQYSDYQLFDKKWVPGLLRLESYTGSGDSFRLTKSDTWTFEKYEPLPEDYQFSARLPADTLVHYHLGKGKNLSYYQSYGMYDSMRMLELKKELNTLSGQVVYNCATSSVRYMLDQFKVTTYYQDLKKLINRDNTSTLDQIYRYLYERRYWVRPVLADLSTLMALDHCQILINFPENHFCVLGECDDNYVRLIDFQRDHFYYRIDRQQFEQQWKLGAALIVATQEVDIPDTVQLLNESQMKSIYGAQGYACTGLLQSYTVSLCPPIWHGRSSGNYQITYERWYCQPAASGICLEENYPISSWCECLCNYLDPDQCSITGKWDTVYRSSITIDNITYTICR